MSTCVFLEFPCVFVCLFSSRIYLFLNKAWGLSVQLPGPGEGTGQWSQEQLVLWPLEATSGPRAEQQGLEEGLLIFTSPHPVENNRED